MLGVKGEAKTIFAFIIMYTRDFCLGYIAMGPN